MKLGAVCNYSTLHTMSLTKRWFTVPDREKVGNEEDAEADRAMEVLEPLCVLPPAKPQGQAAWAQKLNLAAGLATLP